MPTIVKRLLTAATGTAGLTGRRRAATRRCRSIGSVRDRVAVPRCEIADRSSPRGRRRRSVEADGRAVDRVRGDLRRPAAAAELNGKTCGGGREQLADQQLASRRCGDRRPSRAPAAEQRAADSAIVPCSGLARGPAQRGCAIVYGQQASGAPSLALRGADLSRALADQRPVDAACPFRGGLVLASRSVLRAGLARLGPRRAWLGEREPGSLASWRSLSSRIRCCHVAAGCTAPGGRDAGGAGLALRFAELGRATRSSGCGRTQARGRSARRWPPSRATGEPIVSGYGGLAASCGR